MKLHYLLSGAAAAALLVLPVAQPVGFPLGVTAAQAQDAQVSINVFFDELGDYGTWVKHPQYRYVWVPSEVSSDWAPYTHGHWANTERYGWTFVSDEPYAWAVYHYGRWGYDEDIGWYWVPGTVWAPAWVSWRRGHDAVGWAPLPPEGEGYAVTVEVTTADPPRGYWHFVPAREFLAPDLEVVIIHDEPLYEETEVVGPVVVENNIVINNVIDVDYIRETTGQEVQTTKVEVVKDPTQALEIAKQGTVVAVEGQLAKPTQDVAPPKAVEAKEVKAPTVGQDVETTSSVKATEQQPNGEAAPGAGQTGTEQPKIAAPGATQDEQQKAAKGTTGEGAAQPGAKPAKPEEKAAKGESGTEADGANAKRKIDEKTGEATTEEPGSKASGATEEQVKPKGEEQKSAKKKVDESEDQTQSGQAPAAETDNTGQAQGTQEEPTKSAEKKLKKQGSEQGAQSSDEAGAGTEQAPKTAQKRLKQQGSEKGAANEAGAAAEAPTPKRLKQKGAEAEGKAAEQAAPNDAQGQAAKGPRKLKQAEAQQPPSQEKTGSIGQGKAKGGGEQAAPMQPAPGGKGKAKGCTPEQQAAGTC